MLVDLEVEPFGLANEGTAFELSHLRTSAISREQLSSLSLCMLAVFSACHVRCVLLRKKALTRKHKHKVFVDSPG